MLTLIPRKLVTVLAGAVLIAACGGAEDRKAEYLQRGEKYFAEHNYDKAKVEFKNVLQIDPKAAKPYFYLAQIEESKQQWREAYGYYQKAAELDPKDMDTKTKLAKFYLLAQEKEKVEALLGEVLQVRPRDIEARMVKAALDNLKGQIDAAIAELDSIMTEQPSRIDTYLVLALMYEKRNDSAAVLQVLQQGLDKNAGNPTLLVSLAKTYLQQGQPAKSEALLQQLIAAEPGNLEYRGMLAQLLIQQKRFDEAEQTLRAAISANPDDARAYMTLAEFLTRSGKAERAAEELQKAVEAHPDNATLFFAQARLLTQMHQLDKAEAIYRSAVEKFDGKPEAIKAKNQLAELAAGRGKIDEATRWIDEVLKENPRDNGALLLQGKIALTQKDAQKALTAFRTLVKDQPDSVEVLTFLASAYVLDGKSALAQESLEKAVAAKPDDFETRKRLIEFLMQQKNGSLAIEKVDEYLKIDPKNLDALNLKADLFALEKRETELENLLRQIKNDFPDKAVGALRLGTFYQAQKKYDAAIAEYEAAVSRADNDYDPLKAIVGAYLEAGQADKALARLKKTLAANPKHPTVNQILAMYYVQHEQPAEAIKALKQAIQVNPKWALPYANLAGLYERSNQRELALKVYEDALKEFPNDPNILLGMARIDEEAHNYPQAIERYEAILEQRPDNLLIINNLVSLLSMDTSRPENLERARELVEALEDSQEPAFMDTVGWLAYLSGDYDSAVAKLKDVVGKQAEIPIFQYHLGMAYYKKGDKAAAKDFLGKAVQADKNFDGIEEAKAILKTL